MRKTIIAALAFIASLGITACGNRTSNKTSNEIDATGEVVADSLSFIVFEGDKAPDFECELLDGRTIRLSELKGKVVMLQFTASWCGVCRAEMPHIESQIWQEYKDRPDFFLMGIDRDEDRETMEKFVESTGISYPLAFDPEAGIYDRYALHDSGITRNIVVDRDGTIVYRTRLYDGETFKGLLDKLAELLK